MEAKRVGHLAQAWVRHRVLSVDDHVKFMARMFRRGGVHGLLFIRHVACAKEASDPLTQAVFSHAGENDACGGNSFEDDVEVRSFSLVDEEVSRLKANVGSFLRVQVSFLGTDLREDANVVRFVPEIIRAKSPRPDYGVS